MNQLLFVSSYFLAYATAVPLARHSLVSVKPSNALFPLSISNNFPSSPLRRAASGQYYVDLQIGYPPQPVSLILDTGSSDIWISEPGLCPKCTFATYNVSASSSQSLILKDNLFWEEYGDTVVTGFYVSDEFNIAETAVFDVAFGVVNKTSVRGNWSGNPGGVLGIGMDGMQTIFSQTGSPVSGLLDQLKKQEVITSRSYGVWLGGQSYHDPSPGEITFGGYDPSKFTGSLTPLPLAPSPDQFARLNVWLSSASLTLHGKTHLLRNPSSNPLGTSITLDTGNSRSNFPNSMFYHLSSILGVGSGAEVDCSYLSPFTTGTSSSKEKEGLTLSFHTFRGAPKSITMPFTQFIVPTGPGKCEISIAPEFNCSLVDDYLPCTSLGHDFLMAAYVFVDYETLTLSIAQATHKQSKNDEEFSVDNQRPLIV